MTLPIWPILLLYLHGDVKDGDLTGWHHFNLICGERNLQVEPGKIITLAGSGHTRIDCSNAWTPGFRSEVYLREKLQSVLLVATSLPIVLQLLLCPTSCFFFWHHCDDSCTAWLQFASNVIRLYAAASTVYLPDLCMSAAMRAHVRSSVTLERTRTKTIGPRGFYCASTAAWNAPELSTGHFFWTRPDPAKRWPDPTRDCRQKVWPDPTRPAAPPFPHMSFFNWIIIY